MEYELQHATIASHHLALDCIVAQDETLDSIIPDAFPDALQVVSCIGNGFLTSKQISEGSVRLGGTVCINVFYLPDGEHRNIRSLPLSIPFQCVTDNTNIRNNTLVHAEFVGVSTEAHLTNPRKLFAKVEIRVHIYAYNGETNICNCDIASQNGTESIQKRFEECTQHIISAVMEKPFSFTDTLQQSASKPPIEEVLCWNIRPEAAEAKYIGKKIITKGNILLTVLYRSGNDLLTTSFELPFSQIIDAESVFEEGEPEVFATIKNASCALVNGALDISVEAVVCAALWTQQNTRFLKDAYSTAFSLNVQRDICSICGISERTIRRESYRKFCEADHTARQTLLSTVQLSALTAQKSDNKVNFSGHAEVSVVYMTDDGTIYGADYRIPFSHSVAVSSEQLCTCRAKPLGDVTAVPVTGGFEIRVEIEFSCRVTDQQNIPNVVSLQKCEGESESEKRPSVILRKISGDTDLWEVAKSCGSTIEDICAVNKIGPEMAQSGMVLLIPTHR